MQLLEAQRMPSASHMRPNGIPSALNGSGPTNSGSAFQLQLQPGALAWEAASGPDDCFELPLELLLKIPTTPPRVPSRCV